MTESMACDWKVSWTEDGETWHERGFYTFWKAQHFARGLVEENGSNTGFSFFVERMMIVNATSFLNANTAGAVELAPHLMTTSKTFALA